MVAAAMVAAAMVAAAMVAAAMVEVFIRGTQVACKITLILNIHNTSDMMPALKILPPIPFSHHLRSVE
jgi:hypothetical protein